MNQIPIENIELSRTIKSRTPNWLIDEIRMFPLTMIRFQSNWHGNYNWSKALIVDNDEWNIEYHKILQSCWIHLLRIRCMYIVLVITTCKANKLYRRSKSSIFDGDIQCGVDEWLIRFQMKFSKKFTRYLQYGVCHWITHITKKTT